MPAARAPQAVSAEEIRRATEHVRKATWAVREYWFDLPYSEVAKVRQIVDLLDMLERKGRPSVLEALRLAVKAFVMTASGQGASVFAIVQFAGEVVAFRTAAREQLSAQAANERWMLDQFTDVFDTAAVPPSAESVTTFTPQQLRARAAELRSAPSA